MQHLDSRLKPYFDLVYKNPINQPLSLNFLRATISVDDLFNDLKPASLPFIKELAFQHPQGCCKVKVFHPNPNKKLPIVIVVPGTGFVLDCYYKYEGYLSHLAKELNCVVLALHYRLAPEHPYPAAVYDCEYLMCGLKDFIQTNKINADSKNYSVSSISSGTIITHIAIQRVIKRNKPSIIPKSMHFHTPVIDTNFDKPSCELYGSKHFLEIPAMKLMLDTFQSQCNLDQFHAELPSKFQHSEKFPPTLITTAGCDPLKDDGLELLSILKRANVKVAYKEYLNMPHFFMVLHKLVPDEVRNLISTSVQHINKFKSDYA